MEGGQKKKKTDCIFFFSREKYHSLESYIPLSTIAIKSCPFMITQALFCQTTLPFYQDKALF